jgi:hypothetical protein
MVKFVGYILATMELVRFCEIDYTVGDADTGIMIFVPEVAPAMFYNVEKCFKRFVNANSQYTKGLKGSRR